MNKIILRKKYKTKRSALKSNQIDDLSIAIANNSLKIPIWNKSFYHLFLSIEEQKEVNTSFILNILSGKDKHTLISKSNFKTTEMTHYLLTDSTTIKKNEWNIPEPIDGIEIASQKIDVVFIPLLAFDSNGNRIGYGKGFYDKLLANCRPETLKIGLSFFEAELDTIEVSELDIPLNYCITPLKIYSF